MNKKFLCIIFALISSCFLAAGLSACTVSNPSFVFSDGVLRYYAGDTQCTVIGWENVPENFEIPAISNGHYITAISQDAFYGCDTVKSITVPKTVKKIGEGAFAGCPELVSLTVSSENPVYHSSGNCIIETHTNTIIAGCNGSKIEEEENPAAIGSRAFYECAKLAEITIPASLVYIGANAFDKCQSLEKFTVSASNPEFSAFDGILYNKEQTEILTVPLGIKGEVTFPESLAEIKEDAFFGCASLKSAVVPQSVKRIGLGVFGGCSSLESVTVPFVGESLSVIPSYKTLFGYIFGTAEFEGGMAVRQSYRITNYIDRFWETYYVPTSLKNVTVNGGIVFECAFVECRKIESIIAGAGVEKVQDYAFYKCNALKSVDIDTDNTGIFLFEECPSLETVVMSAEGFAKINNTTRPLLKNIKIKRGKTLSDDYFHNCVNAEYISLPAELENLGKNALSAAKLRFNEYGGGLYAGNAENPYMVLVKTADKLLTAFKVHPQTRIIHSSAFEECRNMSECTLGEKVVSIGHYAFKNCYGLSRLSLSGSIKNVESTAFWNCSSLSFNRYGNANYLGNEENPYVLLYKASGGVCTVHSDTRIIFSDAFYGYRSGDVTIPDGVKFLSDEAFYSSGITSVVIPPSVISIGKAAFWGCDNLTSVTVSEGVTEIKSLSFGNCKVLKKIHIPSSVKFLGAGLFAYNSALEVLTVSKQNPVYHSNGNCIIETNSDKLVAGCKSSVIPDYVKEIGARAFYGNSSEFVTVPDSVNKIGESAFYSAEQLEYIIIGSGVTLVDRKAFFDCENLKTVFYNGTEEDFEKTLCFFDNYLTEEKLCFYSENPPTEAGSYWRYVNGKPAVWE